MAGRLIGWQLFLGFLLGAFFGQRFAHLHPIGEVKNAA